MDQPPVRVSDTGPLLHLHWVGASVWALPPQPILVVDTVAGEVERFEPDALDYPQIKRVCDVPWAQDEWTRQLDDGEVAALSLAVSYQSSYPVTFMCDERSARRTAAALGLPVIGSVGLILAAFASERVNRETAKDALKGLPVRGQMRLTYQLLADALSALDHRTDTP